MESITLKRQLEYAAAPQALWSALADTSRLHRALGQVPLTYRPLLNQPDSAARFEMFSERAWGGLVFWELPVEWQTSERLVLRREYPRGPLRCIETRFALSALHQGTRLAIELVLAPRSSALRLLLRLYGEICMRRLMSTLSQIAADLSRGGGLLRRVTALDAQKLTAGASAARGALSESSSHLLDRLLEHVAGLDDLDDDTLHPYALADAWGVARGPLLDAFLAGTAQGLFTLHWDVICPSCRRPAARFGRLSDLPAAAVCPRCELRVESTLHDRVEASFAVAGALRPQVVRYAPNKAVAFAVGGPVETPHIEAQILLPPTSQCELSVPRAPGDYELFVRGGLRARLNVSTLGQSTARASIGEAIQPPQIEVAMGGTLHITHEATQPRHLSVLRADPPRPPCAAHAVTLQPLFRRLLVGGSPAQLLPSGRLFAVPQVALLHTELTGLLELQQKAGDADAFRFSEEHMDALRAIIERPRSRPATAVDDGAPPAEFVGAIVRREREGLLAAFADADIAAQAAVELLQGFALLRASHPSAAGVGLRIGIYSGPAQLVTPQGSGLIDYFGTTLALCLRLLREAHAGDIVLPASLGEALAKRPPESAIAGLRVGPRFMLSVRGVEAPVAVVRANLDPAVTSPPSAA